MIYPGELEQMAKELLRLRSMPAGARTVALGINMNDPVDLDPVDYFYKPFDEPPTKRRVCEHCGKDFEKWARRCEPCWKARFVGPPNPPPPVFSCSQCRKEMPRSTRSGLCYGCINKTQMVAYRHIRKATAKVSNAVKSGRLRSPRTMQCKDCGGRATEYDHRDYSKPLDVEPVCHSCNKLRGPGLRPDINTQSFEEIHGF